MAGKDQELGRCPRSDERPPSALAALLYGAKPIAWRGRSELPQFPWPHDQQGLYLVLDLWSGLGGLLVGLLALGIRCIAVSAEQDTTLHAAASSSFPNLVIVKKVEDLRGQDFRQVLERRNFVGIIIGGGSPCQGNSSLNSGRRGWQDPRSRQPLELQRIVKEIRYEVAALKHQVPVLTILENVASSPQDVRAHYTNIVGGPPVEVNASLWGWVQRKRCFWLHGPHHTLPLLHKKGSLKLPEGFSMKVEEDKRKNITYKVCREVVKPWPSSILF